MFDECCSPCLIILNSDLKTRLQRDRREERLYIRLTKNEKERLRQFAGKVGMPLGEFVLNISLVYTEQYDLMAKEQKAV